MFLITHMGLWLSSVLVTHCHGSCGKREHAIYHENYFFGFNHLKLCQTLMDFCQICHKPTSGCLIWKVTQHVITAGGWGKRSLQSEQLPGGRGRGQGVHCSGTTPCNHTTSPPHHTTPPLQPQKLFTQDHVEGWQEKITLHLPVFVFVFLFW